MPAEQRPVGGRKITPAHRLASKFGREFIPGQDFDRFKPIHILKRIGTRLPKKGDAPRWSRQLIDHLELLVSMTQERDWDEGRPVVWMSVAETADRLGISRAQVNYNENQLLKLGAVTWTDSANHKRWGRRDERGRIIEAYGINLAPLGQLTRYLENIEALIEAERREWKMVKTAFTSLRRHIRGIFSCPDAWEADLTPVEAEFNKLVAAMSVRSDGNMSRMLEPVTMRCRYQSRGKSG